MTTFLWHDYETFGLSPSLDRPAQFAAIRTDENLNAIGKPICWYCKPSMDTMPDPQSVGITGILPQYCEEHGLIEADFARATFWRNFISPYDREFDNGCSRFDLFPLVVATWALRPEGINWPKAEGEDRPTFRLEKLSEANGLTHEHAHDALSDVQATIEMARLIKTKQPKLWEFKRARLHSFGLCTGAHAGTHQRCADVGSVLRSCGTLNSECQRCALSYVC